MPREKKFGDVGENAGVSWERVEAAPQSGGEEGKVSTYCEKPSGPGETLKYEGWTLKAEVMSSSFSPPTFSVRQALLIPHSLILFSSVL